jgi:DNA-directed RNA polymerase specialized sigma24 family protein
MNAENSRYRPFPETRWSLVMRAGKDDETARNHALADLCALYWPPVYAYIRSRGHAPHDAEDLTQGFFAKVLERNDFSRTDASRGKLRSYLLGAAKHYLSSERRDAGRLKRGGGALHFSIDAAAAESRCPFVEPTDELTPDRIFDRQWATTLLEGVIRSLEASYRESGKGEVFVALRPFIVAGSEAGDAAIAARALGLSDNALRVAIHRLRQRYAKVLREAIADTLAEGEDLETELAQLMVSFR